MSDINTPNPGEGAAAPTEGDEQTPPAEMSSYNIEPPPAEGEAPGVPDASGAKSTGVET